MKLIPHRLNAKLYGIRSLIGFGILVWTLSHPVLYLHYKLLNSRPKAISERTSYHGVWLVFRSYSQVISGFFNIHEFEPPPRITLDSLCSKIDHLRFGSIAGDWRVFTLAFAWHTVVLYAATYNNSQTHYAKGRPSYCYFDTL